MAAQDTQSERLGGAWVMNAMHCSAGFAAGFVVTTFRGRFEEFGATLADGQLSGDAQVASIRLSEEFGFRAHVMSEEFFDAERHPAVSFRSDRLALDGDHVQLDGQITIKGVTRPVQATGVITGPVADGIGHVLVGFSLQAQIDRRAHDITWGSELPDGRPMLDDEVTLTVELEFMRV